MCRARRPTHCGAASRPRTTKSGAGAKRTLPPRPRSAPRTSRKSWRCANGPRRSPARRSGFKRQKKSRSCKPSGKRIGPVSRGKEKSIWDRFRAACDRFFTRRHEDLAERKVVWAQNLAKKDALCVRAEALAESTDWDQAAAEIKKLQAEWRAIGPVKKSKSEAVWNRFRGACDRFFARYAARHDTARAERVAAREAICTTLEALTQGDEAPADLAATVRTLRSRWQQEIAARGVDPDQARALDRRFETAFAAVVARWPGSFAGSDLDPDANRKRMETLVRKMEDLAASLAGPGAGRSVAVANESSGGDAQGCARGQHHWRQGRQRGAVAGGSRRRAPGAVVLVADRIGARRCSTAVVGSIPAGREVDQRTRAAGRTAIDAGRPDVRLRSASSRASSRDDGVPYRYALHFFRSLSSWSWKYPTGIVPCFMKARWNAFAENLSPSAFATSSRSA